jgi:allophanate hydrolase subunit 1
VKDTSGSVSIAMAMTNVYSLESPGGWHLIGRTPVPLWNLQRAEPALLAAGDKVLFIPISLREHEAILGQVAVGTYELRPHSEATA